METKRILKLFYEKDKYISSIQSKNSDTDNEFIKNWWPITFLKVKYEIALKIIMKKLLMPKKDSFLKQAD